jgi:hypothetical protein
MNETFFREAGDGPGVVCLHSNASSSSQWKPLMQHLGRAVNRGPPAVLAAPSQRPSM